MIQKMIFSTIVSFLISVILGPIVIPWLTKLKFGQSVRSDGPKTHLKKAGTPTMGGIIIIISLFIADIVFSKWDRYMALLIMITLGYGVIGFLDDYIKVRYKRSLGLTARQKLLGQFALAILFAYFSKNIVGTDVIIPFLKREIDLGYFYIPFIMFVVVGTVNSVNLTDGLDGLASGVSFMVTAFFTLIGFFMNNTSLTVFGAAITGALLGFLKFNRYPAEVFMGDTGSLAIGGAVAALATMTKLPVILVVVGIVYVAEALSVIMQVVSFRLTGKRIFKMSPLHHHFELSGWSETKVVFLFWIVTLIAVFVSFYGIS
ncbi:MULTISPECIES: phospho-N-acetylmuramoyl-pentapeptide-transferase [Thermoanaerobacterium]|uniref:Phospho-N-acetylmuramoyl-pentapeptide-transferase n=2 Tax=Thermoanaerobacterium TaxID=28895 RepID=W9E940_9THEO|nr:MULTISPECIES: phospho-N-acetylmuramoyl-pentapeptide-transferase [Thermoanaerobacterium]AFK86573.1 Phospho-N-acetylmuramoyl-pentapeptide-transferase [Thermoanaerobacterium saccharolyticum JW/SL-YS485]ETO38413.1 Phospho-N-acetylmuramoyl-pentapeptide-transferase [Thermoanaerobacterium aotearoense SCUT27]